MERFRQWFQFKVLSGKPIPVFFCMLGFNFAVGGITTLIIAAMKPFDNFMVSFGFGLITCGVSFILIFFKETKDYFKGAKE